MLINDIVIVANLGGIKIYKANSRDLEAEAGLKPDSVKLDLVNNFDYIDPHLNIGEVVTDSAGQFKGVGSQNRGGVSAGGSTSLGEANHLEMHREEEAIEMLARNISEVIEENNPPKWYMALPQNIYGRVFDKISTRAKEKLEKSVKKDLVKIDKSELIEQF
ncbi:host attachment protein [Sulfurovum sp. TSL1]|uniref:host attachment protein n=1 Tax=Sulfurovum sp. TSL1 TaxID=2826994 RepID=UPI001CC7F78F|nr:host attachment protein [Sulfurovum sp. TSL1]GIT98052.1 hypothetical protein TSL1_08730 [Sulfurovum sp. TSL1]